MNSPSIVKIETWAAHLSAAPKTSRDGESLFVAANGTRTCAGGWQIRISGFEQGTAYRIDVSVIIRGVPQVNACVRCLAIWGCISPLASEIDSSADNDSLLLTDNGIFSRTLIASDNELTLRYIFRYSSHGEAKFGMPVITAVKTQKKRSICIAVATGSKVLRHSVRIASIADNVSFYGKLCEEAPGKPDIIVLPEIALHHGVAHFGNLSGSELANGSGKHALDLALPLESDEVGHFISIAKRLQTRILVGLFERSGDAVHNSAVLVGPSGIEGVYRKVHLADYGEANSGELPGDSFPVFETPAARIGAIICMDSSAVEASRMIGLNGADVLCMPIMGDHRASRFTRGVPDFNEDRWKVIMRAHALNNQFIVAAARNNALGSCIVDQCGDIIAWNDGTSDVIFAETALHPVHRIWNGGRQRDVLWMQRRPDLYGAFTAETNGALDALCKND